MFEVSNDTNRRTVTVRLKGFVRPNEMKDFAAAYRTATDTYAKGRHLVLADMRGLKALEPESATLFGEVVQYGRERGCLVCVHVSDSVIARLQTARVASETVTENGDITVNCVSIEEADKQLAKARTQHFLVNEPAVAHAR
ncbi:hypothetical protein ACN47A_11955 [Myxococcus fulvus]|uniref:hypothetical protein n=1 Tax=Myxococcus fulvus TaxID=33 RepID=UPI003B9CDB96